VNSPPPKPEVILTNFFAEPTVLLVPITSRDITSDFGQIPVQEGCNLVDTLVKPILTCNSEMDSYLKLFRAILRAEKVILKLMN
jgi:hypothetical protein